MPQAHWDPVAAVQPVTFSDSYTVSSKNAWWRRQLMERSMRLEYEEDSTEPMFAHRYPHYSRPCSYMPPASYHFSMGHMAPRRPVHM